MSNAFAVIRRGDTTSHGGEVLEGFPQGQYTIYGVSAAGLGHRVSCPKHPGLQRIAEGESSRRVHGIPIALEGMLTTCGATLIPSQNAARAVRQTTASLADIGIFHQGSGASQHPGYLQSDAFDQQFWLLDEITGEPVADRTYRITMNGRTYEGRTDADGKTQ